MRHTNFGEGEYGQTEQLIRGSARAARWAQRRRRDADRAAHARDLPATSASRTTAARRSRLTARRYVYASSLPQDSLVPGVWKIGPQMRSRVQAPR